MDNEKLVNVPISRKQAILLYTMVQREFKEYEKNKKHLTDKQKEVYDLLDDLMDNLSDAMDDVEN